METSLKKGNKSMHYTGELYRMGRNSIQIKVGIIHLNSPLGKAKLSRGGTRDSLAWKKDKKQL